MKKWLWFICFALIFTGCSHKANCAEDYKLKITDGKRGGKTYYTGLKIPDTFAPREVRSVKKELGMVALPASYDLRALYKLSPIENQGSCGSCWAFSIAATFQDALAIKGIPRDLSEQYMVSCNPYGYSCNGGFFEAHNMHMSPKGGVNQADMPYTATNGSCKPSLTYHEKISSWSYLAGGNKPSIEDLKAAIYKYGTISVGVSASNSWSSYRGGVFNGCQSGNPQLNHAVNLVGWDDAQGVFIMRNSWGTNWGMSGYGYWPYGCDGIGAQANFIVFDGGSPDPTPPPSPDPTPVPPPVPPPTPDCTPQPSASTGTGASISLRAGATVILGMAARAETTYYWTATPAFESGAKPTTSRVRYKPNQTKTLTIHATTKCGEAVKSVTVNYPVQKKELEKVDEILRKK